MSKLAWRLIPILVFCVLCVFLWRGLSLDPHHLPSVQIGKRLPHFSIAQLTDEKQQFEPQHMLHQVVLLNVWASWCAACVEEQEFLMQLAQLGVPIYGLNYKDKAEDALPWLKQWGNPYKLIGQDADGKVAIDLGVYGAPETFVIDKHGVIRYRHVGIIKTNDWQNVLEPMMKKLEQEA